MSKNISNKFRKWIGVLTALVLSVSLLCSPYVPEVSAQNSNISQAIAGASATVTATANRDIQDGVTLHCWNWSFKNIEANMALISELGYTSIQTSPIQQAKQTTKGSQAYDWWVYYQPCNFTIDNTGNSALGTKADFISMCNTAHKYGIKVIVDVVANHLANQTANVLSPTIPADIRNDANCWHDYSKNTQDYTKRYDITQWCMNGLPDLNTGNIKIQNYVIGFLKECIDAGADGFRFDAAKHIETPDDTKDNCASNFWPNVINAATNYAKTSRDIDLYCYGELLDVPGGPLPVSAYTKYMSVTDNSYSNTLRYYFESGNAGGAGSYSYHKDAAADKLVLWAESHDTYAGGESKGVDVMNINKTWAIIAARDDAMSLYFARPTGLDIKLGEASKTGWYYDEVAEINKFHNEFVGKSEYMSNENGLVYCERGNSGVVIVNCSMPGTDVNIKANQMADGKYIDQISGTVFTVEDGRIKGTLGYTGIAVVYNPKTESSSSSDKNVAYLELPSGWSTNVYCYAYDYATDSNSNASWPGVKMTKVSGSLYKYEVPNNIDNPCVIFTDGSNQYPGANQSGLVISGSMIFRDGTWKKYEQETTTTKSETTTTKKNEGTTTTKKGESSTTTKKSESETTTKKGENETTTKKGESTTTTKKNEGTTTTKKNEGTTTTKKNEGTTTTKKGESSTTTSVSESDTTTYGGEDSTTTNNSDEKTTTTSGDVETTSASGSVDDTTKEDVVEDTTKPDAGSEEDETTMGELTSEEESASKEQGSSETETTISGNNSDDEGGMSTTAVVLIVLACAGIAAGAFVFLKRR